MAKLSEAERLRGWLLYNRLLENMQQEVTIAIPNEGPDPNPVGKLYFKRSEIFDRIVKKMYEMAPDGVSSQHQFVEILEQAINTINNELKREYSPDEMADIVLTINDVQSQLMFTPYRALNLNESRVSMGKDYVWKEDLKNLIQDRIVAQGKPNMSQDQLKKLLSDIIEQTKKDYYESLKKEIDETLDMIYNTLRMVPAAVFFAGQ